MHKKTAVSLAATLACLAGQAQAAEWSDTFIGYRYGEEFREPNNTRDVTKSVLQLGHVSGYALGQNFFNLDVLQSDRNDPAQGGGTGATEFYLTYRHQLQLGKALSKDFSFGPVKDVALTAGFDLNTKDTAVAPRKRFLAIGPTLKFNVPGFLDVSLLAAQESNHNGFGTVSKNVNFDTQLMFNVAWGIPFQAGPLPLKFQGFLNYLTEKGKDYNGVNTAPETLMRTSLMLDAGQLAFNRKNLLWVGVGYEYWNNKFGYHDRSATNSAPKDGIRTTTPTLQAELHF